MFKVNQINGDYLDTLSSPSSVLGQACHKAIQAYLGGNKDRPTPANEGEAIKFGHEIGLEHLSSRFDGFIEYTTTIPNRAKMEEKYAFAYFGYIKEYNIQKEAKEVLLTEEKLKYKVEVDGRLLPIPLKGIPDVVWRDKKGRVVIDDHKFTSRYSPEEDIDGEKLLQAIFLYLLVAARLGENPHRIRFREFKITANADKSPQTKEYEMVYENIPEAFELFYRYYEDVTDALLGKQVYVPNLKAMFDKEVSIMAYIHRLDVDEERAKKFKEMQVENITDFLKKKIQTTGSMKKYLDTVAKKFISANTLNYKDMKIEDRIKMKLAEHGLGVEFDSMIVGNSVTLYRYEPSIGLKMSKIEAYTKDIEQTVGISGVRVLAPIPSSGLVGFEVPNKERTFVHNKHKSNNLIIGVDVLGAPMELVIEEMPHLLVAGSAGSGKSVFLGEVVKQLKNKYSITIYDPKGVDFEGAMNDAKQIAQDLNKMVDLMKYRYSEMKKLKVKKWSETGKKSTVIVIDEYNDLFMSTEKIIVGSKTVTKVYAKGVRTEDVDIFDTVGSVIDKNIKMLAQKARAAGIHIILATQRPSVKVLDGDIKANFPTRISFRLPTKTDSKVVLDQEGAETLLGKGDGLLLKEGTITRFQAFSA